jgi:membrane protease YdiL (CAAX protease family)
VNPIAKIVLYLLAVVLIALFLAPPVFWGLQALGAQGIALGLESHPFHRVFSRITQIAALVLLWPMIRWVKIQNLTQLGIEPNPRRWRDLAVGLGLAITPVAILAAGYVQFDILRIRNEFSLNPMIRIFFTAAFVSVFEEFLFRGVLLGLAIRSLRSIPALTVVSVGFSVIHFIKPKGLIPVEDVTWMSGFHLLGSSFEGGLAFSVLIGGMITLFVIGWITGVATLATRSLWMAIGLHAGWILIQQSVNLVTRYRIKPPEELMPWVGPSVVSGMVPTGVVPVLVLLVTGGLVWWYLRGVGYGRNQGCN